MKNLSTQKQLAIAPLQALIDMAKTQQKLLKDRKLLKEVAHSVPKRDKP